jgi:hypothetical protein
MSEIKDPTGMPLWFRQFITWGLLSAGVVQLPDRASEWPDHFDNTQGIGEVQRTLFYKDKRTGIMLPFKGRAKPVEPDTKIGIEAHITAVAYGTTRRARKFWEKAIGDGLVPDWERWGATHAEAAQRMALHQRFWKVPYHWVSLLNGDVLHNNNITRYTYAGNGGNGPLVQVSLEGNYPGLEKNRKAKHNGYDEHTILTGRAGVRLSVTNSRALGAPIELLYAHRQYSDGRLGDPGEGWWKEIGIPMCEELKMQRRASMRFGSGNEIPNEWDPTGLVDYRGRRIVPTGEA